MRNTARKSYQPGAEQKSVASALPDQDEMRAFILHMVADLAVLADNICDFTLAAELRGVGRRGNH
jgi:hypothetical protein